MSTNSDFSKSTQEDTHSNLTSSSHVPKNSNNEPSTFNIQILPAGSAPKDSVFQPNVGGELAPGQPNNSADTTYDKATEGAKIDVQNGLGDAKGKPSEGDGAQEEEGHRIEIKSATEQEPETAESL